VVRDLAVLFLHRLATVARLAGFGGARSVVAESVLVTYQLLILNRSRKRSPNLSPLVAWSLACVRSSSDTSADPGCARASVRSYRWPPHCQGRYQKPMAA